MPFIRKRLERYGTAIKVTDDNITQRMRIASLIPAAENTHSEYLKVTIFPR